MTTTERPRAARPAAPGPNPAPRGVILVVAAVVLGIILLVQGGGVGFDESSDQLEIEAGTAPTGNDVDAPVEPEADDTPTTSVPPAVLNVVALNGAGINGFAGQAQQFLSVAGYTATEVGNAASLQQTTTVHFAPGYEVDAATVAQLLGLELGNLAPLADAQQLGRAPTDVPPNANLVITLAPDVASVIERTPTTPAAPGADTPDADGANGAGDATTGDSPG